MIRRWMIKTCFFEEKGNSDNDVKEEVTEKVEEFFKCLKKVPNKDIEVSAGEPYIVSRSIELPPRWDGMTPNNFSFFFDYFISSCMLIKYSNFA